MSDFFKEDKYWEKHINKEIEIDKWFLDYKEYFPEKGKVLDLGCGVGQDSKVFMELNYDVLSTDISSIALNEVKKFNSNIMNLDLSESFPLESNQFDIVYSNLAIHFFSNEVTIKLISEIKRVLKDGGIFVGSVNSIKAYEKIKDHISEIEYHYYQSKKRKIRLFDINDLQEYLKEFKIIKIEERETTRFNHEKNYITFIVKK